MNRYNRDQWLVKPARRLEIKRDPATGLQEIVDTTTGETVGQERTLRAAQITRRKMEAGGMR